MTVRCNLTGSDYRAFYRHVLFRHHKVHWLYGGMLALLLLLLTWLGMAPEETTRGSVFALIGGFVVCGGIAVIALRILRVASRSKCTCFRGKVGEQVFELTEDGLVESNSNGNIESRAPAIRLIDETPDYFFIITTTGMGHVIPKRDLRSTDALRVLRTWVAEFAT